MAKPWTLTVDHLVAAAEMYRQGLSMEEIGKKFGVSKQAIHKLFTHYEIKRRTLVKARALRDKKRKAKIREALKQNRGKGDGTGETGSGAV